MPSGRLATHYRERRPSKPSCSGCGTQLSGVPRGRPIDIKRLAKSSKRPNRMFGGKLCSQCSREEIKTRLLRGSHDNQSMGKQQREEIKTRLLRQEKGGSDA